MATALTLGRYHSDLGRFSGAESVYRHALNRHDPAAQSQGKQGHPALLIPLADSQRRQGRLTEANSTLELAAATITSPSNPLFVDLHNAWGIVCKDSGRYRQAADHYATAAAACPDDDLNRRATLQHNLAGLAHVRGHYVDAEAPAREALRLRVMSGADPLAVAADATVLGAVLAGQHHDDEADILFAQAIAAWTARFGPHHYEVAVNRHNLAALRQGQGRPVEAQAEFEEALGIKAKVLGPHHPEVAIIRNNLATLLAEQGELSQARQNYRRALADLDASLGADHPVAQQCRTNCGRLG